MPGKILSSREEDTNLALLQDMVFMLHDVLGRDEEPATTVEDVMMQLDLAVADAGIGLNDAMQKQQQMSYDLLRAITANHALARELTTAADILNALVQPVDDDAQIDRALGILRHEGQADVTVNGASMVTSLKFSENDLREALRVAIVEYNSEMAAKVLNT